MFIIPSNLDNYISGPQTICDIGSNIVVTYSAPKWPGVEYDWDITGQGTENFTKAKRANEYNVTISSGYTGTFTVILNLSSSVINCTATGTFQVDVYDNKIVDQTPVHCYGSDAGFSIENYNSNMTINWSLVFNGVELLNITDYPLTVSKNLLNKAGVYNLYAEVHMNGMMCIQKLDFTVRNPVQSPIEIEGQQYICPGHEYMYSIAETSPGDVEWEIIGGTITGQPMKNHVTVFWFTNQTSYRISARWKQGDCESEWTSLDVFSKLNLTAAISGPNPVCNASTTEYTINYPNAEAYTWRIDPPSVGQIIDGQSSQMVKIEWNNVSQSTQAKVILDILDCNLSKYYELIVTVNKGALPIILGHPCVAQSSTLLVSATGASNYLWDFGDGSTMTSDTNTVEHIYQTEGSYFVKVSWSETSNCYDQNYANSWVTAFNQEKIDIYPYKCRIDQNNNTVEDCIPLDCLEPEDSYILKFYATQFTGLSDYRWEVTKPNTATEYYTTTLPLLILEQPINGPYIGATVIVRTDHNTSNRKCIISDTFDIPLCITVPGECEHDSVTVNIIEDGWEGCTIYKYHGEMNPFEGYPIFRKWWAVNDGKMNPKFEIIDQTQLLNRQ